MGMIHINADQKALPRQHSHGASTCCTIDALPAFCTIVRCVSRGRHAEGTEARADVRGDETRGLKRISPVKRESFCRSSSSDMLRQSVCSNDHAARAIWFQARLTEWGVYMNLATGHDLLEMILRRLLEG